MKAKVLVFESDAGFAEELRKGLTGVGCQTTVVDDANAGLQAAARDKPDLILLSIELPRMNGFSVCNKLKRDSGLKNVPLIIMSSDSTEETFEQHRRLRTRAEDYVHKPISFGDLMTRAQAFVQLDGPPMSEAAIVLDDDIEIEEAEVAEIHDLPEISARENLMDQDVSDLTEKAFGAIAPDEARPSAPPAPAVAKAEDQVQIEEPSEPPPLSAEIEMAPASVAPESAAAESVSLEDMEISDEDVGAMEVSDDELARASIPQQTNGDALSRLASEGPRPASVPPRAASVRPPSIAPRPADGVDVSKLKIELDRARSRVREVEEELRESHERLSDLEHAQKRGAGRDAEVQRLQRELDEVKSKLASGKGAGSAREFLDLREQLNRKDKDLIELRDQLTHKDKDLLAARDHALTLDRDKADLSDRISELEKQISDLNKAAEIARNDKDQANKRAEDFKRKGEKTKAELDARTAELAEANVEYENLIELRDAREAELKKEHEAALKRTGDAQRIAIAAIEEEGRKLTEEAVVATKEEAAQRLQQALEEASEGASAAKFEAIAAREAELKKEHDARLAALHRANEDALGKLRAESAQALSEAEQAATRRLQERETELLAAHEQVSEELAKKHAEELSTLREWKEQGEAQRDARIASLESELSERSTELTATRAAIAERDKAIGELSSDVETRGRDLASARDSLAEREARIGGLEAALAAASSDLDQTRGELGAEKARLEKARAKWQEDRASLERAKDALAAALAQIEEAESRQIE